MTKLRCSWAGALDSAGRFVLSGDEAWYYPDGTKRYQVTWRDGMKTGLETYWLPTGATVRVAPRRRRLERVDAILAERKEETRVRLARFQVSGYGHGVG
jgi:hypothetical protein